ncbi:MAG: tRNA (guanine(10)-N(2))-dimethyltransferase [Candidatus Micrarchaeaceae archaeon]|jgi:tRNA (guanine26-N2/guanine27-N2)-dimethyltransferase
MYKEGKAIIKYTKDSFLNADGAVSRDISVAFISNFADKSTKIVDATSATGLRGIRYYLETPSRDITFLEINKKVFNSLKKNVKFNKVKANALHRSIQEFANNFEERFDIIDLDPFGGVTPYIYDLLKMCKDNSYLLVTATDSAVLCGADFKACMRLYDARPMHNELCQEAALRILIGYIARIASQFNFGVEVQLSFSYMHYTRVFLKLHHGSNESLESIKKMGYIYYCGKCGYRNIKNSFFPVMQKCPSCRNEIEVSGKLWAGNIYDYDVIKSMIKHINNGSNFNEKSAKFLQGISDEADAPLYYSMPMLTRKMGIGSVSHNKVIMLLKKKGFMASTTHLEKAAIRTNADIETIKKYIKNASKD